MTENACLKGTFVKRSRWKRSGFCRAYWSCLPPLQAGRWVSQSRTHSWSVTSTGPTAVVLSLLGVQGSDGGGEEENSCGCSLQRGLATTSGPRLGGTEQPVSNFNLEQSAPAGTGSGPRCLADAQERSNTLEPKMCAS